MTAGDVISTLVIGSLMGILGQGARAAVGLKVMSDYASAAGQNPKDLFDAVRLLVSVMIGFLVGLAAALIYLSTNTTPPTDLKTLVSFVAAGYIGVDFLEAFINKYVPQPSSSASALIPQLQKLTQALQVSIMRKPIDAKALVYEIIHENQPMAKLTPDTKLSDLNYNTPALDSLAGSIRDRGITVDNLTIERCQTVGEVIAAVEKAG